ncbi:hypothetical protein [Maribacter aurantiacus]|uniref:Uncharacterized protein n=1 Tax=Maribacter aurantiacus TaxID=1882343 RepID=A0A5R8M7F5_9FLAO|nr:hypothetical protein [Maribacter aurantiacus]TLF45400.1 hypothetical protein FEK29_08465 [Maribacter aurantiacus]
MGVYLLNISVDTIDPKPEYIPENLAFNDQESIVEIVVEQLLGFEEAFEEFDDPDTEEHNTSSKVKINLISAFFFEYGLDTSNFETAIKTFPNYRMHLPHGFGQLITPPPKV